MGKRLIVYTGRAKTGFSANQESLYHDLDDPGFETMDVGSANASLTIHRAFRKGWSLGGAPPVRTSPMHDMAGKAVDRIFGQLLGGHKDHHPQELTQLGLVHTLRKYTERAN